MLVGPCRLSRDDLERVLKDGMKWTEKRGISWPEDRQVRLARWACCWAVGAGCLPLPRDCWRWSCCTLLVLRLLVTAAAG